MLLGQSAADGEDETNDLVTPAPTPRPRSRGKKQSTAALLKSPRESWGTRFIGMVFRPRVLLVAALCVCGGVFGPRLREFAPELSERQEYRLASAEIEISEPPPWVPDGLVERVIDAAKLPASLSLLDESLTGAVAAAFQKDPWVARVVSVRKSVPARVVVELEYRRPVAMVQVQQGLYPVDAEGTLLPPADFSLTEARKFPAILNAQSLPRGPAGTKWGDLAVAAAAELADILQSGGADGDTYWSRFRLAAIRLPVRTTAEISLDDLTLELITSGGSRIVWGRPPDSTHPGELTAEQKIGRLEKYDSDFGGFDSAHGPYEIDIRHWQEISRRPLTMHNRGPRS